MVDLHTHSTESDGELSPGELIDQANENGLSAIALTDHDTVAGVDEAQARSDIKNIRFIPGVEISVQFEPGECHLLGLNLKKERIVHIEEFLKERRRHREIRNQKMIQCMRDDDLDISLDAMYNQFHGDVIGRLHFARWLIAAGKARDVPDAFKKWLGVGRPYYARNSLPSMAESVQIIHQSGGQAVVAHPKSLWISWSRLNTQLAEWKKMGLDGIEALHSGTSKNDVKRLLELAQTHDLFITGGSDFHGTSRPDRVLGHGPQGMRLDDSLLEPFQ